MNNDNMMIRISRENKLVLDKLRLERMESRREGQVTYNQIITDILEQRKSNE